MSNLIKLANKLFFKYAQKTNPGIKVNVPFAYDPAQDVISEPGVPEPQDRESEIEADLSINRIFNAMENDVTTIKHLLNETKESRDFQAFGTELEYVTNEIYPIMKRFHDSLVKIKQQKKNKISALKSFFEEQDTKNSFGLLDTFLFGFLEEIKERAESKTIKEMARSYLSIGKYQKIKEENFYNEYI